MTQIEWDCKYFVVRFWEVNRINIDNVITDGPWWLIKSIIFIISPQLAICERDNAWCWSRYDGTGIELELGWLFCCTIYVCTGAKANF